MLTFAMALTIPSSELDLCMKLARPGYAAISLTNDLYSWRKEYEDAQKAGQDYVFNAVWVIMQERGCSEDLAIHICREEIKRYFSEFDHILQNPETKALSKDTQTYLQAVRLSHVGNLVWSIYCPRYQRGVYVTPLYLHPRCLRSLRMNQLTCMYSSKVLAPQTVQKGASRVFGVVLKFILSPFQHVFQVGRRLFRLQKLARLVS